MLAAVLPAGKLAVDDDDIEALPRQALGNQRSGDAAADHQRVAFQVFGYIGAAGLLGPRKPRRAAAAQVGLLGVVGFEAINGTPSCSPYGAKRNTGDSQPPAGLSP